MYATFLQVCHDILLIGGALLMILGVILMIMIIVLAGKVNNLVTKGMHTVSMVSQYIMLPFTYLMNMFSRGDEKEATASHRKSGSSKK